MTETRRHFMRNLACLAMVPSISTAVHARSARHTVITLAEYRRYLTLFTSLDERVFEFYSENMVFQVGDRKELKSPRAILDSYRRRLQNVRETAEILFFCSDSTGLAAELRTEYRCVRDEDDASLFGRALKKGEVKRSLGVALYTVSDGKFTSMHGNPRTIDDWHIAAEPSAGLQGGSAIADRPGAL